MILILHFMLSSPPKHLESTLTTVMPPLLAVASLLAQ